MTNTVEPKLEWSLSPSNSGTDRIMVEPLPLQNKKHSTDGEGQDGERQKELTDGLVGECAGVSIGSFIILLICNVIASGC